MDKRLGYNVWSIEGELLERAQDLDPQGDMGTWGRLLHDGSQTWVGLSPHTLQTPYDELERMCEIIQPGEGTHVVDLGAGYGRMGHVLRAWSPGSHFTGVECVKVRVDEGNRSFDAHGCHQARLILQDMSAENFTLPMADCYMIYDYGRIDHIRWTMGQLQNLAGIHRFKVIARGKAIRSLIQYAHPWLYSAATPIHEDNFSVYGNYIL